MNIGACVAQLSPVDEVFRRELSGTRQHLLLAVNTVVLVIQDGVVADYALGRLLGACAINVACPAGGPDC
jgi:hypothetical protein